jgi:tRNA-dihydrouridine synthase
VFSEEIVCNKLLRCKRVENARLGTVEFRGPGGSLVFTTHHLERGRIVAQLGVSAQDIDGAVKAALMLAGDVAAIDINMGCPKVPLCTARSLLTARRETGLLGPAQLNPADPTGNTRTRAEAANHCSL